jgi:hypothetical protein
VRPGLVAADRVAHAGTRPDGSVRYTLGRCAAGGMCQPMRSRSLVPRETSP